MMIVPLYAALGGLVFAALSFRTLSLRRRLGVAIGPGDDPVLARAMRVHANFAEYVPIALILLFFLETETDTARWILHVLGSGLLIGRIVHAFGVSQVKEDYRFRVTGMAMTLRGDDRGSAAAAVHLRQAVSELS